MKNILFSLFLLPTLTLFSQFENSTTEINWTPNNYEVGKIYPGYIIKLDGDTISGFIKADTRCSNGGIGSSNQNSVLFYTNQTDKKPTSKYTPTSIKGYKIADKIYESINYSGGLLKKPNFNLVVEDGAIRIYEWYSTVENYNLMTKQANESWKQFDDRRFETKLIVAKNPSEPIEFSILGLSFTKKLPPMIDDNSQLTNKVINKEKGYTFLNIFSVIKEYNDWSKRNK